MKINDWCPPIRAVYTQFRRRYGRPRIYRELQAKGVSVGRHRIARLMRQAGLRAQPKRRYRPTTDSKHDHPIAANVLNRANVHRTGASPQHLNQCPLNQGNSTLIT